MSLAALGAIAGGLNQGLDLAQRDQELQRQRQMQDEGQDFMRKQRRVWTEDQARKDQEAADMQTASKATKTVKTKVPDASAWESGQVDASGNPIMTEQNTEVPRSQSEIYKAQADVRERARDYAGATALRQQAFKWDQDAASRRYSATSQLGSKAATAFDFVNAVAPGVHDDESPIGIRNIKPKVGDDGKPTGGVTFEAYNKNGGYSQPMSFDDLQSAKDALTAHYSPDLYNKLLERRQAAQDKILEEQSKGHVLPAGGQFVPGVNDPRKPVTNDNGLVWTGKYNPDGSPEMIRPQANGSGSSGAGGSPADAMKLYTDAFKLAATEGDMKMPTEAVRIGQSYLPALSEQGIAPQVAARISLDAAADPTKTRLEINHKTGEVDRIYRNPDVNRGNAVVLARGAGSIKDLEKQAGGPEKMRDVAVGVVNSMLTNIPEEQRAPAQAQLLQIASDPGLRKQYLAAASQAGKDVGVISRQLDLIGTYVKPDQSQKAPTTGSSKIPSVGGIPGYASRKSETGSGSYDELMKAKKDKDDLLSAVSKMSPDRREVYLASRLPQIEQRIKSNENYPRY